VPHPRNRLRALLVVLTALSCTLSGATVAHAAPSKSELTKRIAKASDALEDITEEFNKSRITLKKTEQDVKTLEASLAPAQQALQVANGKVKTIASTSYMQGRVGPMNVLLTSDRTTLMERLRFLQQITDANQKDIDTYTQTTQTFAERQATLKATQAKQSAQVKELDARRKKIEKDLKALYDMRRAAYGSATQSGSAYSGPIPKISGSAGKAVTYAYKAIGKPYGYGDDGPGSYDCSGLTSAAWRAAGKSLPHNADAQIGATARISRSDLQPGDLVFYRNGGHVAIYVGGGQIIDAPHAGTYVNKRTINIMTPTGYGRVR